MHPFGTIWLFTRERLAAALSDLQDDHLTFRPWPSAHSIAEQVFHVAGAEHYWASRMSGNDPARNEFEARLDRGVFDGFLIPGDCAIRPEEATKAGAMKLLEYSRREIEPIFSSPSELQLAMPLTSPVGDAVDGLEGLRRLCQHAAYHTGQIWLIRQHPDFPPVA